MKLVSVTNGGEVDVTEEFGKRLVATGQFVEPAAPKKKPATTRRKARTKKGS